MAAKGLGPHGRLLSAQWKNQNLEDPGLQPPLEIFEEESYQVIDSKFFVSVCVLSPSSAIK